MRTSGKFIASGVALGIGGVIAVAPGTASALTCASPGARAPQAGSRNVPTDTLLWGFPASSARLIRPSGEEVPLDERMFEVTGPAVIDGKPVTVPVLVPHAELERNAAYAIEVDYGTDAVHLREFSTGAGPTRELPAPPVLVSSEPRMSAGWQGWGGGPPERWLELQFEYDHILIGDAGGLGPFASIDDLFIDPAAAQKASSERERLTWITSADGLSVGRGGCISWPEGAPDIQSARFGSLDLAGNFSGWVEVPLELPSEEEARAVLALEPAREPTSQPRVDSGPSACSLAAPVPRGTGVLTLFALGVGWALTSARRARR
jgi:hypothetical protein